MNKIIKNILTILLTILQIIYIIKNGIEGLNYLVFLSLYILYILLSIKDIIKKNNIKDNKKYNILQIIVLSIMTLVFIRTLYDPSFLYNSKYLKQLKEIQNGIYVENAQYETILYLLQNINYFIALIILILIYRKINMEKQESKYNSITIACLIISIISFIPSVQCLSDEINVILYAPLTLILISTEIYRLIKDNKKCKEWPIYISWVFNTFAIISIIINIVLNIKY